MLKSSIKQFVVGAGWVVIGILVAVASVWYIYEYLKANWIGIAIGASIAALIGVGMGVKHLLTPKESK